MARRSATALLGVLGCVLVLQVSPPGGATAEASAGQSAARSAVLAEESQPPLYVVMDVSGSMAAGRPRSKLDAAKAAAYQLVHDLPSDQDVTLVSYPGTGPRIEGCSAGQVLFGPGVIDKAKITADIRGMDADGGTPTGPALLQVRRLFEASTAQQGTVVLLSDGEANCGRTNVCQVAKKLNESGLALTINTVGLDIGKEGARQLRCIADATGGTAITLEPGEDLGEALAAASTARLAIQMVVPSTVETLTGTAPAGQTNRFTVTVSSTGAVTAKNVRIALSLSDGNDAPGAVYTPSPVRHLGNLGGAVTESDQYFVPRPQAGTTGPARWRVVVSADNAATVSESGTVALADSATWANAGPLLTEAKHVVVLGDSYSSGEGAGDYDRADARGSGVFACHRSSRSYARQLYVADTFGGGPRPSLSMIACSGAVSGDLKQYQHRWDVPPQLAELSRLANDASPPDLALMTLGGNDAEFGEFVIACVLSGSVGDVNNLGDPLTVHPCGADPETVGVGENLTPYLISSDLTGDLVAAYKNVHAILNSEKAVASRDGRIAQIVVLPYANPLPPVERLRSGCFFGLADWEARVAEEFVVKLNGAVSTAVDRARRGGVPVRIVQPVVNAFQDGHTICDEQSAVVIDGVPRRKGGDFVGGGTATQELMHPNDLGQRLEAQVLIEWSRTQPPDWTAGAPSVQDGVDHVESRVWGLYKQVRDILTAPALGPEFVRILEPGEEVDLQCRVLFSPNDCEFILQQVVISVHVESEPRLMGAAYPQQQGEAIFDGMRLPSGLAPGRHTLVVLGVDEAGELTRWTADVRVFPEGSRSSLFLVYLALALLLLAAVGHVCRPRQRGSRTETHP